MFTGLIERRGHVRRISRGRGLVIEIEADAPWLPALADGESVAVDGVCLTVARHDARRFTAHVLEETATRSTLGGILPGAAVNLERALRAGDRFGGHVVQGHVDGIGTLWTRTPRGRDFALRFRCGRVFAGYCVEKGSVAINGVSLTIAALGDDWLEVDVIPTTAARTNLGALAAGVRVNLESDVLGRYAVRQRAAEEAETDEPPAGGATGGGLTWEKLVESGFA